MHFHGFPKEALEFYEGIAAHNDTRWFEDHRDDFSTHVVEPAKAFIEALGERLRTVRPDLRFDTNHTGRGSFKKIHTDRRFQKDRPPFKTYAQMIFWEGPLQTKKANSCAMVHIDPTKIALASGLKYFDGSNVLKAYRADVAGRPGKALADAVDTVRAAGYEIGDATYKKTPRGYDPEHSRAPLLLHSSIYAYTTLPVTDALHGPEFVDLCAEHFEAMAPVHAWCVAFLDRVAG